MKVAIINSNIVITNAYEIKEVENDLIIVSDDLEIDVLKRLIFDKKVSLEYAGRNIFLKKNGNLIPLN